MEIFKPIDNKFNTTFIPEEGSSLNKPLVAKTEPKMKSEYNDEEPSIITIDEEDFIKTSIMDSISSLQSVMKIFEDELKVGTKAFAFEAYSNMTKTLVESIKELKDLGQAKVDNRLKLRRIKESEESNKKKLELMKEKIDNDKNKNSEVNNTQNNFFVAESGDIMKRIIEARKNSSLNSVEAKFDNTNEKVV